MDLKNNETIIRQGRANHLKSSGGIGGKLYLTDQRLFFKPHSFNAETNEAYIPLQNIKSIAAPHNDFISKKLVILQDDDLIEFFVVNKRREWIKEIENAVFKVKLAGNVNWHNDTKGIQEISKASRLVNRKIFLTTILIGTITGFIMFMIL